MIRLFIVLFLCHLSSGSSSSFLTKIRPQSSPNEQASTAEDVIGAFLGNNSRFFSVHVNPSLPQNTFVLSKNESLNHLYIEASDGVSACRGFNYYLEEYLNGHISWDGQQLDFFSASYPILPNIHFTWTSSSQFTYYQNVCTWSYSFAWWLWQDWQRHIYWMALQGINLALAPFQELVWKEVYTELGMTEEEIKEHISGPAFLAWQRMGNIRGWGGPLPDSFMERNSELQSKIIELSNSLGISLALPAFAGHVPLAFKRLYPSANFTPVVRWNRFEDRFCCPLFLDPVDPLFQDIGGRFLSKMIALYGTNHIYFADPFNEINPMRNDTEYMASVSQGIYKSMKQMDADAVLMLQGWMFVKNPFWGDEMIESFLTAVPLGRILVLDLQSEQHPQYERTYSYYGQPYIWCMLHNFGGTLDIHGSLSTVNQRVSYAKGTTRVSLRLPSGSGCRPTSSTF